MIRQSGKYVGKENRERKERLRRLGMRRAAGELEKLLRLNRFFAGGSKKPLPVGYSRLLHRPQSP